MTPKRNSSLVAVRFSLSVYTLIMISTSAAIDLLLVPVRGLCPANVFYSMSFPPHRYARLPWCRNHRILFRIPHSRIHRFRFSWFNPQAPPACAIYTKALQRRKGRFVERLCPCLPCTRLVTLSAPSGNPAVAGDPLQPGPLAPGTSPRGGA